MGVNTPSPFVHLHVHTQYSLLQGAMQVEDLLERSKKMGFGALAITDTHNLFGAIDFYLSAKKAKIQPIIGCEIHFAPEGRAQQQAPGAGPRSYHLVLLCKSLDGYRNLCQMVSRSYIEAAQAQAAKTSGKGAPVKAIVDRELLDKFGDGLVVLSGCIKGELPAKILLGDEEGALKSLQWFKKRFKEDFYLEMQDTSLPEQEQVNSKLVTWAEKHGIECVATADCHYLDPSCAESHEVLQCIELGKNLDFDRPKSLVPAHHYLKSSEEMAAAFAQHPKAISNTVEIAAKCNFEFELKDKSGRTIYHLPKYRPDDIAPDAPFDLIKYFRAQARQGLAARFDSHWFEEKRKTSDWSDKKRAYEARLDSELAMIEKTGFAGYFLVVADFINWAKKRGIPVGPGRGSGAGSIVAYAMNITDIDPIEFNLLFERFINPERISMPDFDVDFCQDRRGEVIEYVSNKYGKDNVCQIITFGKLQARAVVKDVSRVMGLSFAESDSISKLLPDELNITLDKAIAAEPRLRERMEKEPKVAKIMQYGRALEGLYRNAGVHAAGVIITENPVVSYCPLYVGKDGGIVTQFDKDFSEAIGLVKFDFLGLKTLTVIDNAVKLIGGDFSIDRIDHHDAKVYELISSGDTDGVFQVESSGMKDLCTRLQPGSIEDLTAINALYRPGPLGSGIVDDFIECKHKRKEIRYDVEALVPILKDTYGVILYQEQVMQIARELAGYSLGQADLLRRAMGKKKHDEMAENREIFVKGAVGKGLPQPKAEAIFDLMAKFAEYGFNKSHSAAYAVLTYQTAFLKAHYPAEFMAALMTTEMDNTDKITRYIADARAHKIPVLVPDVNRSQKRFSVEVLENQSHAVRFGLEAIKGVGGIAVDVILEARLAGPFQSVLDFCRRVSTRKVNKKVIESLTLAGAFDSIAEVNRASLFASLEGLLDHAGDEQAERELGQNSLFDSFNDVEVKMVTPGSSVFKQEADWPQSKKLLMEKQVVGFYVSGHPMDTWQRLCEDWLGWNTESIKTFVQDKANTPKPNPNKSAGFGPDRFRAPKMEVRLSGLISDTKEIMTKKGSRMAFASLEDLRGKIEVIFFPDAYAEMQEAITAAIGGADPVLITGDVEFGGEAVKVIARSIEPLAQAHHRRVQRVVLLLKPAEVTADQLRELKKHLLQHRGKCPVRIDFVDPGFKTSLDLPRDVTVEATPQMVESVNRIFGREVVVLR